MKYLQQSSFNSVEQRWNTFPGTKVPAIIIPSGGVMRGRNDGAGGRRRSPSEESEIGIPKEEGQCKVPS